MTRAVSRVPGVVAAAVAVTAAVMAGCRPASEVDVAAEKQALGELMERVNAAWESEDLAVFSQVVAHDPDMVNFGSDVGDRWIGWEGLEHGLREQFEVFSDTEVTPRHVDIRVSDTGRLAWLAQAMSISTKFFGQPVSLEARITGVFEKRGAEWRLVQFHYSVPISESKRLSM